MPVGAGAVLARVVFLGKTPRARRGGGGGGCGMGTLVVARVGGQQPSDQSPERRESLSILVVARAGSQQPSFADIALHACSNRLAGTLGLEPVITLTDTHSLPPGNTYWLEHAPAAGR